MVKRCYKLVVFLLVSIWCMSSSRGEHIQYERNGTSGVITSPNYNTSSTYPENLNISWTIRVRPGFRVELYFTAFDLEDSYDEDFGGPCVYDFVQIKDEGVFKRKFCGSTDRNHPDAPRIMQTFASSSNELTIDFVSDYSNEDPMPTGFVAHYREEDRDECQELRNKAYHAFEDWDTMLYCNQHCHNVPSSYYCSCDPGFKLHENRHTCTSDCDGETLYASSGEITTSRYPSHYSKLADCDWTIQQKEGISIELRFVDEFSIEEHPEEGCVYDYVEYEDAAGNRSKAYCGKQKPNKGDWILTNSQVVKVFFHSDLVIEEAGFKLEYRTRRTKCPRSPQAPANGSITSVIKEYEFEDNVTFSCAKGYRLKGKSKITCQSDGTWDAEEPTCHIKHCQKPYHIENAKNGRFKEDNITLHYGSKLTFLCYTWYEMTSGTSEWKCEDDEEWHEASVPVAKNENNNIPKCEPICGLKGNKDILRGTYNFGDTTEDPEDLIGGLIVGGKKAREAEWPWIVFLDMLGRRGLNAFEGICAGSLVSPNTVVTAAHCTRATYKHQIRVYAGVTDRSNATNVQVFSVKDIVQHENYSTTSEFESDIAILKLNATVKIGKYARPICLPRSQREKELPSKALSGAEGYQKRGVIAGWGKTETGWPSFDLLEGRIPPISYRDCVANLEHSNDERIKVSKNMLCGGFVGGGRDSCQGDSGGPYMFKDPVQLRWILNGIVSYGSSNRCGDRTYGIYTNVAKYVQWLEPFLADD